jgi:protein-S-isoprenylcysteine O-methyltransferase Ste14
MSSFAEVFMSLIWLILSVLAWGMFHSVLASLPVKSFFRRLFGLGVERVYRLGYNLLAGLSFLPVLALVGLHPGITMYNVRWPWSALMFAGELLAILALAIGILQSHPFDFLGLCQLMSPGGNGDKLTTTGLYHYVRHPLYSTGLVILWLVPRMTVNLFAMNLALTAYIIIGANLEERKLIKELGQEYVDYMANTPMFIPFLKAIRHNNETS